MYLRVHANGSRQLTSHPNWRTGDTPETARLLSDEELLEHNFYAVVDLGPSPYNTELYTAEIAPIEDWILADGQAIKVYVLQDRPVPSDEDINSERRRRIEEGAEVSVTGYASAIHTQGRTEDQINYMALKDSAKDLVALGVTAPVIPFRDKTNTDHLLTPAQIIELVDKGKMWLSSVYQASWTIKALDPRPMDITDDQLWPSYIVE